jgi:hypothetical protein
MHIHIRTPMQRDPLTPWETPTLEEHPLDIANGPGAADDGEDWEEEGQFAGSP